MSIRKYVVDFKSGFGSNEKGNTNRLLLVASIYNNIEDNYQPLIFVRSSDNNNYFTTLKESGVWQAYSGSDTYNEIYKYSGHNIKEWIDNNIKEILKKCKNGSEYNKELEKENNSIIESTYGF